MPMTHEEFLQHIRSRYASLLDPDWKDDNFQYFILIDPGWQSLVVEYCDRVEAHLTSTGWLRRYFLRQIKEKFGTLRIYLRPKPTMAADKDGSPIEVEDFDQAGPEVYEPLGQIYDDIAARSQQTCEECGKPGELRVLDGWYRTCCDQHFAEWQARKAK
ncbi:hypothetical protein U8C31_18200 [Sinorhizobium medicae]|uniref:hypothetical protein n=1 Tax=Sinorhizobium medicae TaxID=110321 RepID=UPI002AF6AC49|nr:hypothetical protein [Sinorhizobium medicae]WQO72169.1 hypothetical protein U8C31_18200 [Sinorhizobium medicae]